MNTINHLSEVDARSLPHRPSTHSLWQGYRNRIKASITSKFGQWTFGSICTLVLIYSAVLLAYTFRYTLFRFDGEIELPPVVPFDRYFGIGMLFVVVVGGMLQFLRFSIAPQSLTFGRDLGLIFKAVFMGFAIVAFYVFATVPPPAFSRWFLVYLVPLTLGLLSLGSAVQHRVNYSLWLRGINVRNVLVVGATDSGMRLMRTATANATLQYKVVGYIDDSIRYSDWTIPARYGDSIKRSNTNVPYLGVIAQLSDLIAQHRVDEVAIALPNEDHATIRRLINLCRESGVAFTLVPDLLDLWSNNVTVQEVNGLLLLVGARSPLTAVQHVLKSTVDVVGGCAALLVAAIPMLAIAIAVKLDSPGPIIFRQTRVGKNGIPFTCFKFRSMFVDADARLAELAQFNQTAGATFKMVNDPRVTRVGRFIRRTSLDELPQIFNVLLRQMSLVGPRPGLPREIALYQPWQYRRLAVMPGITGLWQVNGRSSVSFDEMVKMDIYYAEHWSLDLDIRILFKTVSAVLKAEGAY